MNQQQLDTIRERAEKATPGPWSNDGDTYIIPDNDLDIVCQTFNKWGDNYENHEANIEFITNAREDVPQLLAEIERLQSINAELLAACQALVQDYQDYAYLPPSPSYGVAERAIKKAKGE